jgi:hypothetical protein
MGRKLDGDDRELDDALRLCGNSVTAADMRMALSIVLPGRLGVSLQGTAKIIGTSQATVSRLRKKFLTGKRSDLNCKSGWGGRRRGNLSETEEGKFIKKWNAAAEKGNIKTLDAVHMDYMRISKVTSPKSTVHRLMKRHGWEKVKSKNGAAAWKMS